MKPRNKTRQLGKVNEERCSGKRGSWAELRGRDTNELPMRVVLREGLDIG